MNHVKSHNDFITITGSLTNSRVQWLLLSVVSSRTTYARHGPLSTVLTFDSHKLQNWLVRRTVNDAVSSVVSLPSDNQLQLTTSYNWRVIMDETVCHGNTTLHAAINVSFQRVCCVCVKNQLNAATPPARYKLTHTAFAARRVTQGCSIKILR